MISESEYFRFDGLSEYMDEIYSAEDFRSKRIGISKKLERKSVSKYWEAVQSLAEFKADKYEIDNGKVSFKIETSLDSSQINTVKESLQTLMPWRKGPWNYLGVDVDAEWVSSIKWDRIAPHLPELKNKRICDIGCNNLYFMYRMLEGCPRLVYGIDPMERYFFHFLINQKLYYHPELCYDMMGVDDLIHFKDFFDISFFMGIIYHRRDPLGSLKLVHQSLRSGGTLVFESSGIPGDQPYFLFPESRYTKAPGYWFIPTESAMVNMLKRTGFHNIRCISSFKLTLDEQRKTQWAQFESLKDFLDPEDENMTVEGYPAPWRFYFIAEKK